MRDIPLLVFKVMILGEKGVGKSTFVKSFSLDKFDANTKLTLGIDLYTLDHPIIINGEHQIIRFSIWVSEPYSQFRKMATYYFQGSDAIFLMFDVSNLNSLKNVDAWMELINKQKRFKPYILLLGNKVDLISQPDKLRKFAEPIVNKYQLAGYYDISALHSTNTKLPFVHIAEYLLPKF